ncbi:hypothetical protein IJI94_01740 [Candidatus Saccharibacteria bacterium]|nr:hypothetical protein [Candidatus Saccharibacteria bacterium]
MDVDYTKANNEKLEEFVMQMISDKGAELDDDAREEEKDRLLDELSAKLDEAMINALPDDKAEKLDQLLNEKGNDAAESEIHALIYGSTNEINAAVEATMNEFRDNYLKGEA